MMPTGIYGKPPAEVVDLPADAIQFSPLMPGASALEQQGEGTLASMTMLAPPGTLERRYAMALALRAVAPGGAFTALAPKDQGGTRLRKELQAFGCTVEETARRHHRIAVCARPDRLTGIDEALPKAARSWSQILACGRSPACSAGTASIPARALLLQHLPALSGRGADFGCGIGVLARAVLASAKVTQITLIDIDRRAIEAAQRNIDDPRVRFHWADVREPDPELTELDFVVMNAPFHDAGTEDRALALSFVKRAAEALRNGRRLLADRQSPFAL